MQQKSFTGETTILTCLLEAGPRVPRPRRTSSPSSCPAPHSPFWSCPRLCICFAGELSTGLFWSGDMGHFLSSPAIRPNQAGKSEQGGSFSTGSAHTAAQGLFLQCNAANTTSAPVLCQAWCCTKSAHTLAHNRIWYWSSEILKSALIHFYFQNATSAFLYQAALN